jgi:cell wall-associated NlpC family hydrolase
VVRYRRSRRTPRAGLAGRVTVLSAAATAAVALAAAPVVANPQDPSSPKTTAGAQKDVDELLAEAERAIEAYNGIAERVEELEAETERRQQRVAQSQQAVNDKRTVLGHAAAAHYRAGSIAPSLALLLTTEPEGYLDRAATLDRLSERQAGDLRELISAQRVLEQRRDEARDALAELEEERNRLSRQKQAVLRQLALAERRLEELTEQDRKERAERHPAPDEPAGPAGPAEAGSPLAPAPAATAGQASSRAAAAVAAATSVVGAPYAWGAAGPSSFDCSGLIQWAYAQAGVSLPRTSQEQARAGRTVPLTEALPGDIVVYRDDASHVGMFVGNGQVVHAPYTGASVRYESVTMMPLHSVVRP